MVLSLKLNPSGKIMVRHEVNPNACLGKGNESRHGKVKIAVVKWFQDGRRFFISVHLNIKYLG